MTSKKTDTNQEVNCLAEVNRQMRIILKGAEQVINEEELRSKLTTYVLTGKSKTRRALSDKEVLINAQTYTEQIFRIPDADKTEIRYNGEWLELLSLEDILKLASTITVARMLERDDFHNRYANNLPIGLHEFFYPLMQAYDSVAVKANIELGGIQKNSRKVTGLDAPIHNKDVLRIGKKKFVQLELV